MGLGACAPQLDQRLGLVEQPRILAVRGLPAEARPGEAVDLEALVVSPGGTAGPATSWAFCTEPRRAEERTAVSASCARGERLESVSVEAIVPADACARFGPNPPPAEGDEPPRRPADPDPSGGYFLPVRAATDDATAFGFLRIRCDLAGATRAIFDAFQDRYTPNRHPALAVDVPLRVAPGDTVTIEASAPPDDAEDYVVYVAERSRLVDRVEELTASFYATSGSLTVTRAPLAEGRAQSRLTAPSEPGLVHGWVVVVDSRGGLDWAGFTVEVVP